MITYRAAVAGAALGLAPETMRRNADDAGISLERKNSGATYTRIFKPSDLFDIAKWRMHKLGPKAINKVTLAVWGPKGGIGKTTFSANLAVDLCLHGLKVLVIDLDFQGSLGLSFGYDSDLTLQDAEEQGISSDRIVEYTIGDVIPYIGDTQPLEKVIKKPYGENGPHLIPADIMLDHVDQLFLMRTLEGGHSDLFIGRWIEESRSGAIKDCDLSEYDVILFDCPPAKNRLTRSALLASDHVISPVNFEVYSTKAISYLARVFTDMQKTHARHPSLTIVGNEHDAGRVRSSLHIASIARQYGDAMINQTIRRSEDFYKALDEDPRAPLLIARPTSPASDDIRKVTQILIQRVNLFSNQNK